MKRFFSLLASAVALMAAMSSCRTPEKAAPPEPAQRRPVREWRFDFGAADTENGYIAVDHRAPYSSEAGYGWTTPAESVRDRGKPDALRRDFVFSRSPALFHVKLEPGVYRLTLVSGDMEYGDHVLAASVSVAGVELPPLKPRRGEFATLTAAFEVPGPTLDIRLDSPANNWVLNALTIEPATAPQVPKIDRRRVVVTREVADDWEDVFAWPDPIAPHVERFRKRLGERPAIEPTGLKRDDYLKLIAGNVDFFRNLQNADGAIIDPYRKEEFQYSTPCFALAAATLIAHANRTDLLEPAAKAMDWATWTLSRREAATAHEDFFAPQIAHALPLLKPLVPAERSAQWENNIRSFDPFETYRAEPGRGNWNVVALSGEAMFFLMGLREDASYTEACLAGQGRSFNCPWGLYTEGPMAYDHFPRIWAADMLAHGYVGRNTGKLGEVLRRGALTSLFMQSPVGELPAGGRSAHHQWNEAEQCLTYEVYAGNALADGDEELAGVYKRAAHLALASIRRWVRPTGELWIVKNRVDPSKQHGYEGYSSHSQYNLLAMAMLSIAWEHAGPTEGVAERPAPADVGGFVLDLGKPFHRIVANAGGMYVEIDYAADLSYNATGLLRIHRSGGNPQLGPSDALTEKAVYRLPEGPRTTAAVGAAWKDSTGRWRRLAEFGRGSHAASQPDRVPTVTLQEVSEAPGRVSFAVVYECDFDGPSKVVERYVLEPDAVELTVELVDYAGPMRLVWPVLADNGEQQAAIEVADSQVRVSLGSSRQEFHPLGADSVRVEDDRYPFRNGWARLGVAEYSSANRATLRIRPDRVP